MRCWVWARNKRRKGLHGGGRRGAGAGQGGEGQRNTLSEPPFLAPATLNWTTASLYLASAGDGWRVLKRFGPHAARSSDMRFTGFSGRSRRIVVIDSEMASCSFD